MGKAILGDLARYWRDVLIGQGRCAYIAGWLLDGRCTYGRRELSVSVPVAGLETAVIVDVSCFREKGLVSAMQGWVRAFPTRVLFVLPGVVRNGDGLVDRLANSLGTQVMVWRTGSSLRRNANLPVAELMPVQMALLLSESSFVHRVVYRLLCGCAITVSRYGPASWLVPSASWSGFLDTLRTFLKTPRS